MASEAIRQRSDILGTLVVTRDTGKKLGVVSQLWVDVDRREVVALSLRPNLIYGTPQPMLLSSIRQIGDVILVDHEDVIEDINVEVYNSLINCEVITETGEPLGKVRGYKFDVDTGEVTSLIMASLGIPLIPDQVVSTYELPIDEIVSSGPDRLIVFEGAEERLVQITVGVLERMGISNPPWEKEEYQEYAPRVRADNQLGTGVRTPVATPVKEREPVMQETWDEDNWNEPEPRRMRQEIQPPVYYEEEEDNWSEATATDSYQQAYPIEPTAPYRQDAYDDDYDDQYDDQYRDRYTKPREVQPSEPPSDSYVEYDDLEKDVWSDEAKPYEAPPVNIPEKIRAPEYEE